MSDFLIDSNQREKIKKNSEILCILLPKFIRNRMKQESQMEIAENQGNAVIVFCDICNFDQIIQREKLNIIKYLDNLFRQYDKLCQLHGLQKIETVGKTYMASAGLKSCEKELNYINKNINPTQRALNFAQELMKLTKQYKRTIDSENIGIKIGIHFGNVIAGVIGFHKPQFSLIGNTVNQSSRVCSTAENNTITLSKEAYQQLDSKKIGQFLKKIVYMKGLGDQETFEFKQQTNLFHMKSSKGQSFKNEIRIQNLSNGKLEKHSNRQQNQTESDDQPVLVSSQISEFKIQSSIVSNDQDEQDNQFQIDVYNPIRGPSVTYELISNILQEEKEKEQQFLLLTLKDFFFTKKANEMKKSQKNEARELDLLRPSQQLIQEKGQKTPTKASPKKEASEFQDSIQNFSVFLSNFVNHKIKMQFYVIFSFFLILTVKCVIFYGNQFWQFEIEDAIGLLIQIGFGCFLKKIDFSQKKEEGRIKSKKRRKQLIKKIINQIILVSNCTFILSILTKQITQAKEENKIALGYMHIMFLFLFLQIDILNYQSFASIIIISFINYVVIVQMNQFTVLFHITYFLSLLLIIIQQFQLIDKKLAAFNRNHQSQSQILQQQSVLKYLLPPHILLQFLENPQKKLSLIDHLENTSILFADISGFTKYSKTAPPEQVLKMLKYLFTDFDKLCLLHNCFKLYTIGDCYVAVGMNDFKKRNPQEEAQNLINFAFCLVEILEDIRRRTEFSELHMRIGIHTGDAIGGIMGTDIVRYDIYGKDVLIANKMESNGELGKVQVSEKTKELLEIKYKDLYNFTFNKKISIQSIGTEIEGYFITQTYREI